MSRVDAWLARKTPPKTWAEQDERDRAGACESDNWGPAPDKWAALEEALSPLVRDMIDSTLAPMVDPDDHEPFPLLGELPRRGRKTLIGMPIPPGIQRLGGK